MIPKTPKVETRGDDGAVKTVREVATMWCVFRSASARTTVYAWYRNGNLILGAVSEKYRTPPLTLSNDGDVYACAVIVSGVSSGRSRVTVTLKGGFYI